MGTMGMKRSVVLTTIGIAAVGGFLAIVAPPHWVLCELFLLIACAFVLRNYLARNYLTTLESARGIRASSITPPGQSSWLADLQPDDPASVSDAFHPWDFDRFSAKPRTTVMGDNTPVARTFCPRNQSVEQIAHEILMQAFRQASSK